MGVVFDGLFYWLYLLLDALCKEYSTKNENDMNIL